MAARVAAALCLVLPLFPVTSAAQAPAKDTPRFRVVNAKNTAALQQELDRASAAAYTVLLAWPAYDMVVLEHRVAAERAPGYRVLDGEKEIAQFLAQGYCAVADTLDVSGGRVKVIARKSDTGDQCESHLARANRTGTLDKEIQEASAKGFRVIGMASDDSGHAALLERATSSQTGVAGGAALIAANAQDTLQKELAARAAAGYRIVASSSWKEVLLSMEKRDADAPVEYRVLSTTKSGTLEREINASAAEGFRVTAGTLHALQKGAIPMFGRTGTEYVVIMEKRPEGGATQYVLVGARRMGTLVREFDEGVAKGLVPVAAMIGYSDQDSIVLFERTPR